MIIFFYCFSAMRGDVVGDAEEIQNGYEYEDRVGREEV